MSRGCPICSKPVDPAFRPFCSKRCADVDLQRWFKGSYAIPAVESDEGPQEDDGALDLE
ncbi:MAG TPA: DNA gyrase inhibitor YacG [Caulobacteraceae bacterium]|nr:DNA gyrase inhibitor YacG [Caulobacteraceae bacterium]